MPRSQQCIGTPIGKADTDVGEIGQIAQRFFHVRPPGQIAPPDAHQVTATKYAQGTADLFVGIRICSQLLQICDQPIEIARHKKAACGGQRLQ